MGKNYYSVLKEFSTILKCGLNVESVWKVCTKVDNF